VRLVLSLVATWQLTVVLAGCFSPHVATGAPCSPEAPICPPTQSCAQINGTYECSDGVPADDANNANPDSSTPHDALVSDAASTPWTLVQTATSTTATTTIMPSNAGDLIVVAMETPSGGSITSIIDNVGNTYVAIIPARAVVAAANRSVEVWYAKDTAAGATEITVTAPTLYGTVMWEASGLDPMHPLDAASELTDQAATIAPVGASITTTSPGEFVVSMVIAADKITSLTAGAFTNDQTTNFNGWAHLTLATAPAGTYQTQWNQNVSGAYCASSVAFLLAP
jgi:hypothetical protein